MLTKLILVRVVFLEVFAEACQKRSKLILENVIMCLKALDLIFDFFILHVNNEKLYS